MNKTIGVQLTVYSLVLAGLSCLTHHLAAPVARLTLIAGVVGAVLCFTWGLRAVLGKGGKALPILTLIPISFVMLSQTVMTWGGGSQEAPQQRTAVLLIAILFVFSMVMLMRIAYAGVVFDGERANPTKDGGAKARTTGKPGN
jgi:hypothetical protein